MVKTIQQLLKNVFEDSYKKKDIIKEEELLEDKNQTVVMSMLEVIIESLKEKPANNNEEKIIGGFFKSMGLKSHSSIVDGFEELLTFSHDIDKAIVSLIEETKLLEDDVITDKTMTAKEAGVISTLINLQTVVNYLADFNYYCGFLLTQSEGELPRAVEMRIKDGTSEFGRLYNIYGRGKFTKVIKNLRHLSDTKVYEETSFFNTASKNDKSFPAPVNNLTINPVFYARKLYVDAEFVYLDYLKYKKTVFEYKIKEREFENDNPDIKKQIEYYQKKMEDTEERIRNIEAKYNE